MSEHVTDWIAAYHDGELPDPLREQVEAHLAACPTCQKELQALRSLSSLLQADPIPPTAASQAAFTRQVLRRLPGTTPVAPRSSFGWKILRVGWKYAPLFLFGAWAFFQAVIWVSGAALLALQFVPSAAGALQSWMPAAPTGGALAGLLSFDLLAPFAREGLEGLAWLAPVGPLALINLALVAVLSILFLGWLASWWAYHNRRVPASASNS